MAFSEDLVFAVETPLGFQVRVTRVRWELIATEKHPVMKGREEDVRRALESPDEVRQSRTDPNVLLFYRSKRLKRGVCAVAKRADEDGFLVTTYPTDAVKEGVRIWPK